MSVVVFPDLVDFSRLAQAGVQHECTLLIAELGAINVAVSPELFHTFSCFQKMRS